jgi:hypothetical protein
VNKIQAPQFSASQPSKGLISFKRAMRKAWKRG